MLWTEIPLYFLYTSFSLYLNVKRLNVWDSIPVPPLFIEEVTAKPTEEFFPKYPKTPSPLRGTPSINRGRAELLTVFGYILRSKYFFLTVFVNKKDVHRE